MASTEQTALARQLAAYEKATATKFREELDAIKKRLAYLRETVPALKSEAYSDAYDDVCRELAGPL